MLNKVTQCIGKYAPQPCMQKSNSVLKVPSTSIGNDFYHGHLNNCYSRIKSQSLSYHWSMLHEKMNEKYKNFRIAVYDIFVN